MVKRLGDFWVNYESGIGFYVVFYYYGEPMQVSKVFCNKQEADRFCQFLQE